jgi:hypothetical protein
MSIKIEILRAILQHLVNNPGEFQWNHYASITNLDVIDCAVHRQWLREHGFTQVTEGKTYRTDKPLNQLTTEFSGQITTPKTTAPTRSVGTDRRAEREAAATVRRIEKPKQSRQRQVKSVPKKQAEKPKIEKPEKQPSARVRSDPRPAKPRQAKPDRLKSPKPPSCLDCLKQLEFKDLNLVEIKDLLKAKFMSDFSVQQVEGAIRKNPKVTIIRFFGQKYPRYSLTQSPQAK